MTKGEEERKPRENLECPRGGATAHAIVAENRRGSDVLQNICRLSLAMESARVARTQGHPRTEQAFFWGKGTVWAFKTHQLLATNSRRAPAARKI